MSAALPPMHAALSVLGTMAGQYLASQSAQAQSAPPQPPQAQPAFNAPSSRQTTTNAVSLCDVRHSPDACGTLHLFPLQVCHANPKYFDGTKTHSYCSKTCAAKVQNKTASGGNPSARGKSAKPARAPRAKANMCDVGSLCCHSAHKP